MKYVCLVLSLLWLTGCASNLQQNNSNGSQSTSVLNYAQSDADYSVLVNKIRAGTALASDFDKLLHLYPLTSHYQAISNNEQAAKLLSQNHMENQQWQACLGVNTKLLEQNYTSLTAHYGAAVCATELGDIATGKFHHNILDGFIEAIWRTGNGQSPETAIVINSTTDLYAFIQLHQMVAVAQSLTYVNKLPIQAIRVQNPETMRSLVWYFNVTAQFRRSVIDNIEQTP